MSSQIILFKQTTDNRDELHGDLSVIREQNKTQKQINVTSLFNVWKLTQSATDTAHTCLCYLIKVEKSLMVYFWFHGIWKYFPRKRLRISIFWIS